MNLFFFLGNVVTVLLIAAIFAITPVLNRKSLLFGVRVPEAAADLPECKSLKNSYYGIIVIGCLVVVAAAVAQYAFAPKYSLLSWMYFPFVMVGVQFAAFIPQWKKAKALKEERGWSVPLTGLTETRTAANRERLSGMRWGWYIASLALAAILAVWTAVVYPSVPDRLITHWNMQMQPDSHWNMQMQPDSWGNKSWLTLMMMPLCALAFVLIMAAPNIMIYRQKLQVSAEYPALSFAQHRLYRRMLGRSLGFMTFCFTAMFALMQPVMLNMFAASPAYLPLVIAIPCVVGLIPVLYVPIKAGQSGCRLKVASGDGQDAPPIHEESGIRHTQTGKDLQREQEDGSSDKTSDASSLRRLAAGRGDDRFWKLGMFYYNPDDPAVLVEDRFGGNGGFNFARLPSKIFVAVMALITVAAYIPLTVLLLMYPNFVK